MVQGGQGLRPGHCDDGEVLFVHFADIQVDGYRALVDGERVEFVWRGGIQDHGRHRAEDVRPLDR